MPQHVAAPGRRHAQVLQAIPLHPAGVLAGKRATAHPAFSDKLSNQVRTVLPKPLGAGYAIALGAVVTLCRLNRLSAGCLTDSALCRLPD